MVRPLRILGITDNLDRGIDWWRLRTPFSQLARFGCQAALCPTRELEPRMIAWADVIMSATVFPGENLQPLRDYCTKHHKIIVKDLDDDPWSIPDSNPFANESESTAYGWRSIRASLPAIEASIQAADLVTTTTDVLAGRLRARFPGKEVAVLPNCILPSEWENLPARSGLTVGTCGGESHVEDYRVLAEVYPEIHRRFPEVRLVAAGYLPSYLADLDYVEHLPSVPTSEYPKLVNQLDVRLCPLADTEFNRAKSPIALLEASMVCAVPVVSPTVYGEFIGLLRGGKAWTSTDWQVRIEQWIDDEGGSEHIAHNGRTNRKTIMLLANIETQGERWADAYRAAWERVQ